MAATYDIAVTAGIDSTGVQQGTKAMERDVKTFSRAAEQEFKRVEVAQKSASGAGSKVGYRIGQASMQAQDVAVQLQSGAKATTVIAQQGSQIASIFGPTGQIVGGVIAIGAGLASWALSLHATATEAELLEERTKRFEARMDKIRSLSDRASQSIGSNFEQDSNLEARIKGGALAENEVKIDRERNREIQETYDLMTDLVMAGGALSNDEELAWMRSIERKHAAQAILDISERIASVMSKMAAGEHAAAGAAQGRLSLEKEMLSMEEQHAEKFAKQEDHFDAMDKKARQLLEHVKDFGTHMAKGIGGFLDHYSVEAQAKQRAAQILTAQSTMGARIAAAGDAIADPASARAARALDRRQQHGDRVAAEREVDRTDRLNGGLSGHHHLSPAERAQAVKVRTDAARDFRHPKQEVTISDAAIEKLAAKIASESAKQLPK